MISLLEKRLAQCVRETLRRGTNDSCGIESDACRRDCRLRASYY
ncbi:hypothetical protein PATSB16_18460 [Pandoraea thiooxydans]|nr:hypothetical protein PATSB16_18460 [Pandoraea thiooxydans]